MYSGVWTELSRRFSASPKMRKTANGVVVAAGGIHMPLLAKGPGLLPSLFGVICWLVSGAFQHCFHIPRCKIELDG